MCSRTALLLGASGLVGGHCLKLLLDDPFYDRVVTPVRRPLPVENDSLTQIEVDFDRIGDHSPELQGDDVFCCLGTTIKKAGSQEEFSKVDLIYPSRLAEIALANGASQFLLVSSVGADPNSSIFYSRVKGEVEEVVGHFDYKTFHVFRPSLLLGGRGESRPGEWLAQQISRLMAFAFVGPLKIYRPVEAEAVAVAMIDIAKQGWQGRHLFNSEMIRSIYLNSKGN
jgi:uncharacterized protein YbjT (DUF2867 family)